VEAFIRGDDEVAVKPKRRASATAKVARAEKPGKAGKVERALANDKITVQKDA
jgi:hypothetical protein